MATIKCTKKLQVLLSAPLHERAESSAEDWHADLVRIERRRYVLFCHDETRLSCLSGAVRKPDVRDLGGLLRESLLEVLRDERLEAEEIERALQPLAGATLGPTDSRSVLGTMTDNIFQLRHHVEYGGGMARTNPLELARRLNHMPIFPIGGGYAIDALKERLTRPRRGGRCSGAR